MADLETLQHNLGVSFKDLSLLKQALVHSSYVNESPDSAPTSNERLEFLGDAVLGFIVAQKLYQDFPRFAEGEMTKIRAAIVRRDTLVRMARTIGLENHLYLGKGEEASSGRYKPTNLASAFEAVIAAIYLDQGLSITRDIIHRLIAVKLQELINTGTVDYKSELQEYVQARKQQTPTYEVIETTGPDHNRTFTVEVRLGETVLGKGSGKNKKAAEYKAARSALEQLSRNFTE